jgi:5-methyltetrahydrofolate--homocysteine methyltransferase
MLGIKVLKNYDLAEIAQRIDWGPFFQTWELSGPYPAILQDPIVGESARSVLAEGQAMLKKIIEGRWLTANAVFGLFPAASVNHDDIEIYVDETRRKTFMTWHNLRQHTEKPTGNPNLCLADFVAPKDSGVPDYIGAFAVTAGLGIEKRLEVFEKQHDDYASIMMKALADRLAEAFTELLHARVRREFWAYAKDERLSNEELIAEKYRGVRPAPGYPACPDHTEKGALFKLLQAERAGIELTESYAMYPASSVSGFYLSHPESRYFAVGKAGRDQITDYARRKNMPLAEIERWLSPILGYEPEIEGSVPATMTA